MKTILYVNVSRFIKGSMPAVVSNVDVVSSEDDVKKPNGDVASVAKCPFAHGKKAPAATKTSEPDHVSNTVLPKSMVSHEYLFWWLATMYYLSQMC